VDRDADRLPRDCLYRCSKCLVFLSADNDLILVKELFEFSAIVRPKCAIELLRHDLNNHDVIALDVPALFQRPSAGARVYAVDPPNLSVSLARTSS
jgi:hypothetical protein